MSNNKNRFRKYGDWALIAGAGEGIGKAFSEELARLGFNLILIDLNLEKLNELKLSFSNHKVAVICEKIDLSEKSAFKKITALMKQENCRFMVYNAAYGPVKSFTSNTTEEIDYYIDVNARSTIQLVHQLCCWWREEKVNGGIILMSSLAGLFGTNLVAPYGATKAFDYNLAEALYHEMKPFGIDVLGCAAGATNTLNYQNTNPVYPSGMKPSVMQPEEVAKEAIDKLGKCGLMIPGSSNRFTFFLLTKILSRKMASRLMNKTMMKMYKHTL